MTNYKYEHVPIDESDEPLVNLASYRFELEPAYFNDGLSEIPGMYLRLSVAERLATVRDQLAPLNFKIWDGWRPREVQHNIYMKYWKELEAEYPDWTEEQLRERVSTFVTIATEPNRTPVHSTGGSVDLTLVDGSDVELDMGTGFDHFGSEAAALYYEQKEGDDLVRGNRRLLRNSLSKAEFRFDNDEWWHFDYGNQIWAAALNKPKAIYDEITKNRLQSLISGR